MSQSDDLLRQADAAALARRVLLVVNAISYAAALGAQGLLTVKSAGFDEGTIRIVPWVAWPVWALSLSGIFLAIAHLKRRSDLAGLVDDERTAMLKSRVFRTGYWVLLLGVTAAYALSTMTPVGLATAGPFLIALGVATPSLAYAFLYRN